MKKHHSTHANHLMHGAGHRNESDPAAILMRGHHASGGEAKACGGPLMPKYKKGGHVSHRRRHADGGPTDLAGAMSMQQPKPSLMPPSGNPATALKEGGKAMGGRMARMGMDGHGIRKMPGADALKHGGRPRHHKREHHFLGMLASALAPMAIQGLGKLFGFKEGGDIQGHEEGGKVNVKALKRAAGGAGKVRKGMMTQDGHEIR